jgi:hypothetical protein
MMIPFATHLNMYSRISGRSKLQEKLFGDLLGDWVAAWYQFINIFISAQKAMILS